jgi:hypothetical protein
LLADGTHKFWTVEVRMTGRGKKQKKINSHLLLQCG